MSDPVKGPQAELLSEEQLEAVVGGVDLERAFVSYGDADSTDR